MKAGRWALLLALVGCADTQDKPGDDTSGAGVAPELAFPDGVVIDPKLAGAAITVQATGCEATVVLRAADGQARTLAGGVVWDGRDDDGYAFDPGPVTVTATCDRATEATVHVVRLAPGGIDFVSSESGVNVPLAYHKTSVLLREITPIDMAEYHAAPMAALSSADDESGAPWPAVTPWADPSVPPWGAGGPEDLGINLPAAYVAGSVPRIELRTAERAISARSGVPLDAFGDGAPEIRVVVDGATAVWQPAMFLTLDLSPVEGTLGRELRTLTWTWEAREGDTWVPIPGSFTTLHTLWRTAGPSQLRDGTALGFAPAITWVSVLAELEGALTGVAPEPAAVLDALRDHLHESDWIIYDPNDASYSAYSGSYIYWDYAWSELGGWIDRDEGMRLYCHSLSCLYSVLAGHVGVAAPQQVLGVNFTTHLTRAAGTTTWQRWGFNSHSLVSPDGGATLWDASVALDGDDDPDNEPVLEVEAKGLTFEEYTSLLTADPIEIVNEGLCYFE